MDETASHLSEIGTEDWFVQVRMKLTGNRTTMIYEDGSSKVYEMVRIHPTRHLVSHIPVR